MRGRLPKVIAAGTGVLVLTSSAFLLSAPIAQAETISAKCGQTVTAKPGDQISTPFGLQTVTSGLTSLVGGLLGGLCTVTVKLVDTVVAPLPVVGPPVAGAVNDTVTGVTNGVGNVLPGKKDQPSTPTPSPASPSQPQPNTPSIQPPVAETPGAQDGTEMTAGNFYAYNAWLAGAFAGYVPLRDYSSLPMAMAGLFAPSPGLRYGGQLPGLTPDLGTSGLPTLSKNAEKPPVSNIGNASVLPSPSDNSGGIDLATLLAVLALSGVSAALVRTWVLRRTTA